MLNEAGQGGADEMMHSASVTIAKALFAVHTDFVQWQIKSWPLQAKSEVG